MIRALDTSKIELPGVSTSRLLWRLASLLGITLAGAVICGSMLAQPFLQTDSRLGLLADPFALCVASPMIGIGWLAASSIALALLPSRYCLRSALAVCLACGIECALLARDEPALALLAMVLTIPLGCIWLSRFGRVEKRAAA